VRYSSLAASQPFPSLTQCYKQNQQACCVSAHDSTISGEYEGLLSGTCIREYPDLETYYCLGCAPDSDEYIDYYHNASTKPADLSREKRVYHRYNGVEELHDQNFLLPKGTGSVGKVSTPKKKVKGKYGEIKLCKKFAERLLHGQDSSSSGVVDAYDGCGMMDPFVEDGMGRLSSTLFALNDNEKNDEDPKLVSEVVSQMADADKEAVLGGCDSVTDTDNGCEAWPTAEKDTNGILYMSHEWKFFHTMRPTYFGVEDFEISWGHAGPQDGEKATCFGAASGLQVGPMAVALVAILARMLA